ncbi:MAG: hypothetical protein RIS35_2843 [Pseudomonadota bacterium]|jgi:Flp pilus assembly protein TadG
MSRLRHVPDGPNRIRGGYAVEFSLVLILLVVLVISTADISRLLWIKANTLHLAEEGARWAAVRGSKSATPATASTVTTYVQSKATGMDAMTVTVSWQQTSGQDDKSPGKTVAVRVSTPFAWNIMPLSPLTVSSEAKVMITY